MEIAQFPGCCGITVIHQLGMKTQQATLKKQQAELKKQQAALKTHENLIKDANYTVVLLTVNSSQLKTWKPVLKKAGYTKIFDFNNAKTRNQVHLFAKTLQ